MRPLDSLEARALPGTEDAGRPFWSPDGKSLAFVAGGKLKRIDMAGGSPLTLCDARQARGGAWSDEGVIVFGQQLSGLQQIPSSGGTPSPATRLNTEAGEMSHYYPQFLPGGKEFIYLARGGNAEKNGIYIGSLDGKPATRIFQTEHKAVYDAREGRLLYIQGNGTLMARRLELNPPRLTGDPAAVAEDLGLARVNRFADFSISVGGTLFYGRGRNSEKMRFGWRDRTGKLLETVGQPNEDTGSLSLSPDGSRVAYSTATAPPAVWVMDLARGVNTRITVDSLVAPPQWSPDGKQLYYGSAAGGILRKPADGSGQEEIVAKASGVDSPQSVSPDGKYLLFGTGDIHSMPLTGERKPKPYVQTKYAELNATFSPDGRWVAYRSDESGRPEIYIQGFPEHRGKWLVSAGGGSAPSWRADGKELYWRAPDQSLMAAPVELQAAGVRVGRAEPLFRLLAPGVEPARDGRRFLVLEPEGGQQPDRPMVVIQNWAAGLGK